MEGQKYRFFVDAWQVWQSALAWNRLWRAPYILLNMHATYVSQAKCMLLSISNFMLARSVTSAAVLQLVSLHYYWSFQTDIILITLLVRSWKLVRSYQKKKKKKKEKKMKVLVSVFSFSGHQPGQAGAGQNSWAASTVPTLPAWKWSFIFLRDWKLKNLDPKVKTKTIKSI